MKTKFKIRLAYTLLLVIFASTLTSCQKQNTVSVKYLISKASSTYDLQYKDQNGSLLEIEVNPNSGEDIWEYSFISEEGEVVYISTKYFDTNSSINMQILIDGKVFKQTEEIGDPLKYIVVSGVVPIK